jgi:hypothetical protein
VAIYGVLDPDRRDLDAYLAAQVGSTGRRGALIGAATP